MSNKKKLYTVMVFIFGSLAGFGVWAGAGYEPLTLVAVSISGGWMYLAGASE